MKNWLNFEEFDKITLCLDVLVVKGALNRWKGMMEAFLS